MYINKRWLLLFAFVLLHITSCSPRYIKYQRAIKKLRNQEITREEFDKKFYRFYNAKQNYSATDTALLVKFYGAYVRQEEAGKYVVYKFFPNGKSIRTYPIDGYPNNLNILTIQSEQNYFRITGNTVEAEYLMSRDWNLYNIIKTGTVHNDTLTFFKTQDAIPLLSSPNKIHEVYVYDSTITASPY
jgi:hypothetical protein